MPKSCNIINLKELRHYNRKLFLCAPQKQTETQLTFSTAIFQNEFTLCHMRLNIFIWKTELSSHKQYLLGLLFSKNAKNTHTGQSVLQTFLLCLKRNVKKPLKQVAAKRLSQVSIIDTICFNECFLFHAITRRHFL